MDSYQAIYDAVRSKISAGNVGQAIEAAFHSANIGHYVHMAQLSAQAAISQWERPSVLYRPSIAPDGNQWSALYGENIQEGVAGFGDTPALAMADFDKRWYESNLFVPARPKASE